MIARSGAPAGAEDSGRDPDAERRYALATPEVGERALDLLDSEFRIRVETSSRAKRTYYDTFDGRLASEGSLLYRARGDAAPTLRWVSEDGRLLRRLAAKREPSFAADLPESPFRADLVPLIEVRRLLPLTTLTGTVRRAAVLDERGKTTVRVALERWTVDSADGAGRASLTLLRVIPVRGYRREIARVGDRLEAGFGLQPLTATAYRRVLGLERNTAGDSQRFRLEPGMRSDEAVKRIYAGLLETIIANEGGTRARTDPEFLHQFRVAVRRTRAGLAKLKGVYPVRSTARFKRDFAWLGRVTGPMRDLDVHLLEVPAYEASLPEESRCDLAPLRAHLEAAAEAEQRRLGRALDSARYARLLADWRIWLERPVPERTRLPDASRPVGALARERIQKLHKRVLKRGEAIDDDTPAEAVHDLRLDCKKLRYLMEFFRDLFDAGEMKAQIRALKQLQEVLGRFNDFEVQQAALEDAAASMAARGSAPLETVVVMGRLIETSRRRQDEARTEICGRIAAYGSQENRARAARLFAAGNEVRTA